MKRLFLKLYSVLYLSGLCLLHAEEDSKESQKPVPSLSYDSENRFTLHSNPMEDFRIGGYVQIDGRLFLGHDQPKSTFLIRRARLQMAGTLYKHFNFAMIARWDKMKTAELHQAWIETACPSWAQMRVGLFKEPFSLEALYTDLYLNFVERSLVVYNLLQLEDIGAMLHGKLGSHVEYFIGAFNGRGREFDNNNNKEIVGRFVYSPFEHAPYGNLYMGISGSAGRQDEDLSGDHFRTGADTPFWEWNPTYPVEVHDTKIRFGADLEWYKGPFYFATEFLYTTWGHIHMQEHSKKFSAQGGYCEASYLLTGEDKPRNAPVIPKHNFNGCDQWGAWEIAARYEVFYASQSLIKHHFAFGANEVYGPTLALNWYLNPLVAVKLDGQYLQFNRKVKFDHSPLKYEGIFTARVQAVF